MSISHCLSLKQFIASAVIWITTSFLTVVLFLAMLLVTAVTFPFDSSRRRQHHLCFWWSDAVIIANPFWNVTVQGLEHIDRTRTYIIVANHQSLADIVLLFQTRTQFKWIAKDSLFRVPFLGWCLSLARHVRLQRAKRSSVRKAYQEASVWLDRGISVMFFPEGTRSTSGELQNFYNGPFKLALKKHLAVLPIAIQGASNAMPKGKWLFNPDSVLSLRVLPALEPDDYNVRDPERLQKAAWESIHSAMQEYGSVPLKAADQ